jgi:CRP-like cAMP-binding protein
VDLINALQNQLLAALPETDYRRLVDQFDLVEMGTGTAVYESGQRMHFAYFPTSCTISLLYETETGASVEIATIGYEGLVGVPLFMGGESTPGRAIVQTGGCSYRVRAAVLKQEFSRGGAFQQLALRYSQALITQMAQSTACNRHHTVDQQVCRKLLVSMDRLRSNDIPMTHDLIASMLGVRRVSVTETACRMQAAHLIQYSRGKITILDRAGIEQLACECYGVVKREFERLLPQFMCDGPATMDRPANRPLRVNPRPSRTVIPSAVAQLSS